jgi:serine/threonine-protein kinase
MEIGQKDRDLQAVLASIGKDYEVIKKLGYGASSKVYLVQHRVFKHERALKIMNAESVLQRLKRQPEKIKEKYHEISERFLIEAKIYWRIEHPNIVKIFDVSFAGDKERQIQIPYMIIQFIKGKTLYDLLENNSPLKMPLIYQVSENILSALSAIHKAKIIHRDIKPNNIMLDSENNKAVLIDFGLAKDLVYGKDLTALGTLLGHPQYIPPEQMEFHRKSVPGPGPTMDIFSFGVVLFRMLTGKLPFDKNSIMDFVKRKITVPNVRDLNPKLPEGIEQVVFKAVAREPARRYRGAKKFLDALQEVKEKTNKKFQSKPGLVNPARKSKNAFIRSPVFRVILIILLLIALVVTALILFSPSASANASAVKNSGPGVQVNLLNNARGFPGKQSPGGKNFLLSFQDEPGKTTDMNIYREDYHAGWC